MDVFLALDGQRFVWDNEKAARNASHHGVEFAQACEAFLDEARQACIGLTPDYKLLYVVHVIREGDVLRLISARLAEQAERRRYEDE